MIDKIILENYDFKMFRMYEPFSIGTFRIMPYLMDHSAFDAAAFEISSFGKTILYTGGIFVGTGEKVSVWIDSSMVPRKVPIYF